MSPNQSQEKYFFTSLKGNFIAGLDLRYNCITDKGAVYVAHLIQVTMLLNHFSQRPAV